ncbi:type II toxin-antitoxin system YafQ family toxin [Adlercreutzia sp. R21]|uniref:type II toxin-antitoxin system YafQ family toxin n=1 Tax=Adlercreutzia wanghongyangiae TaxID=3111451 RepID=UPI002DB85D3D|nr:type II toxin-antitoxin system YafQ family toxin [Adlercreutzia sp. R21]MEC4184887.1 type II toxin-antitoxin system YafQ family toxin [Adlercreutzia sp. R21]
MNNYQLVVTSKFKKDARRALKRGKNVRKLDEAIDRLLAGESLPESMRDHELVGNYAGHRECHIEPDWLLIYRIDHGHLILTAVRTGTHSDLFGE